MGHLNKKNVFFKMYDVPSLGQYLQREFGNNYFVTAVTVGNGTVADPLNMKNKNGLKLQKNRKGSVEELLSYSFDSIFYRNIKGIESTKYIRSIGNRGNGVEFYHFIPKGRIDGIIFIRKSTNYWRPNDWPDDWKEFFLIKYKSKK